MIRNFVKQTDKKLYHRWETSFLWQFFFCSFSTDYQEAQVAQYAYIKQPGSLIAWSGKFTRKTVDCAYFTGKSFLRDVQCCRPPIACYREVLLKYFGRRLRGDCSFTNSALKTSISSYFSVVRNASAKSPFTGSRLMCYRTPISQRTRISSLVVSIDCRNASSSKATGSTTPFFIRLYFHCSCSPP